MTMKTRKIIRNLRISEVSGVTSPAVAGAIVQIMKAADDEHNGKPVTKLTGLQIGELSLVGSPANRSSRVHLTKSEDPYADTRPQSEIDAAASARVVKYLGQLTTPTPIERNETMTLETLTKAHMAANPGMTAAMAEVAVLDTPAGQAAYNAQEVAKWHAAAAPVVKAKSVSKVRDLTKARQERFPDESYETSMTAVLNTEAGQRAYEDDDRAAREAMAR